MSSSVAKTSKYSYRSTNGGDANVSIEYSADLSALSRLEVSGVKQRTKRISTIIYGHRPPSCLISTRQITQRTNTQAIAHHWTQQPWIIY